MEAKEFVHFRKSVSLALSDVKAVNPMHRIPIISARKYYLDGLANNELRYQLDPLTGCAVFYPREVAPSGQFGELQWRVSQGSGNVYSFTDVYRPDGAYNIVIVELDEGFRLMSTIPDQPPGTLAIGLRVRAGFDALNGEPRLIFKVLS